MISAKPARVGTFIRCRVLAVLPLFLAACVLAQNPPAQVTSVANTASEGLPDKAVPEITTHDETTTFKVNVRLVLVRVVVRDAQGHAVGNLRKEDFRLFDNRKPQVITQFEVEQPGSQIAREQKTAETVIGENPTINPAILPERFIAYLFDDVHLKIEDLVPARDAADRRLSAMQPTDRAAIFTTSGQGNQDFTDDHTKLHEALLRLQPHPLSSRSARQCPYMSYYMADLIVNKSDTPPGGEALGLATQDVMRCNPLPPLLGAILTAQGIAVSAAQGELSLGEAETRLLVTSLENVVRRLSAAPGERTIVVVSPGFITPEVEQEWEVTDIIDHALRSNVIVSTLNARGLYVPGGDISGLSGPDVPHQQEMLFEAAEAIANDEVLYTLADSTGGTFIHNSNDFEGGLKKAAETPEYYYVLGFSPQNLKYDGRFHSLSVKLTNPTKLTLQARKGYFAPQHVPDANEEAKKEIEEALFSQEETHDLPVQLHTQFFKLSDDEAKLALLIQVDAKHLNFHKTEGRNNNKLTIAEALFDRNGTFISGSEQILEMRLKDETLERKLDRGVTVKTSFDVKPGSYLIRLVVRDAEGQLSAENGAIEIP
jgi:VWFA-related protein